MHDAIIASWALITMLCASSAKSCTPVNVDFPTDWRTRGRYPYVNSNGMKPVEALMLELMANSVIARCFGQSSWSGLTSVQSICDTLEIILSDAPLVCGWNTIDLANLMPSSLCISVQKADMNFGSRSLMIVSGSPWRRTTCVMNSGTSCEAVIIVCSGIRCTRDVNLHNMTQM